MMMMMKREWRWMEMNDPRAIDHCQNTFHFISFHFISFQVLLSSCII
jgi:hypothetical protein